jgi:hypothetical protein
LNSRSREQDFASNFNRTKPSAHGPERLAEFDCWMTNRPWSWKSSRLFSRRASIFPVDFPWISRGLGLILPPQSPDLIVRIDLSIIIINIIIIFPLSSQLSFLRFPCGFIFFILFFSIFLI